MAQIELVDEQIDAIVVQELKECLKWSKKDKEYEDVDAIKKVLKLFMIPSDYVKEFGNE